MFRDRKLILKDLPLVIFVFIILAFVIWLKMEMYHICMENHSFLFCYGFLK